VLERIFRQELTEEALEKMKERRGVAAVPVYSDEAESDVLPETHANSSRDSHLPSWTAKVHFPGHPPARPGRVPGAKKAPVVWV